MSEFTPPTSTPQTASNGGSTEMGTFDETGAYTPRQVVSDDLGSTSFEDAIAGTIVEFDDGDIVSGTVVKVDKDEVLLDIGFKSEGVIPARELSIRHDVDPHDVVTVGDKIEALVLQKEDKEGRLVLSKKRAQYERAWGTIEAVKERNGTVRGTAIEVVKGGLILDIGLRGFLPASLVELRRVRDLQPYVGRELEAKIIELDKNRNNVVLSRRAYLEEAQRSQRDEFLTNLKPGEVRKGVVSSVVNFGAFVDLGGMDGLIHVSELSWKHVDHPGQIVAVGDQVTVRVLDVDLDRERISLSLKATQADPWQEFATAHRVGELVYGRVTKLVPFGAFVQVGDGIEGLVHISEMAVHHVDQPDQVVSPGEELWVKIIDIDLARRRISLSIKQAAEGGEVAAEYREAFGEHAYDEHGNYIGAGYTPFEPESEAQAAWAGYLEEQAHGVAGTAPGTDADDATEAELADAGSVPSAHAGAEAPGETEVVEIVEGVNAAGETEVVEIVEGVNAAGETEVVGIVEVVEVVDAAGEPEVVGILEVVEADEDGAGSAAADVKTEEPEAGEGAPSAS
jgi:small subunit ribosomal protein S1